MTREEEIAKLDETEMIFNAKCLEGDYGEDPLDCAPHSMICSQCPYQQYRYIEHESKRCSAGGYCIPNECLKAVLDADTGLWEKPLVAILEYVKEKIIETVQ